MKKAWLAAVILLFWLVAWSTAGAEPNPQALPIAITSPSQNAVVRGTVPIVGTAADNAFWKYEVYFAAEPVPNDQWTFLGTVHERPVIDGLLETWETAGLPDGRYSIKLRVVDRTGNYREVIARGITVANTLPTNTPTPIATRSPTPTATPAATPTLIIPSSPLARPSVTPTLARPTRSVLPDVVDVASLRSALCLGIELMAVTLVVLAIVFALRRRL